MTKISLPLAIAALSISTACSVDDPAAETDSHSTGTSSSETDAGPSSGQTATEPMETGSTTDPDTSAGTTSDTGTTTAGGDEAQIRVVHASAGAPNVDIYVEGNDTPVITDLAYGAATDYLAVPAGTYNFQVRAAGADPAEAPVYETGALELPAQATVTAIAAGALGSEDEGAAFRVLALVEGFEDPGADSAAVRIVHAGADAPTVDINVGNDGGDPELPGVARFADSGAAGVPLPAGAALQVGIEAGGSVVTSFTTPELPAGANLFVIATGLLGNMPREATGFGLLAVGPDGVIGLLPQNPFVHALHASPDAPEVDICVGDSHVIVGASFGDLARVQVPPGAYDLEFHAAPSDCTGDPASVQSTGNLAAGQQYLAIATGELAPEPSKEGFTLVAFQEEFKLDAAPNAVFAVIHAASAPAVDVGTLNADGQVEEGTVLVPNLSWPDVSSELEVPAGNYGVSIVQAGAQLPADPLATVTAPLSAGLRAWAVAVGDISPNGGEEPFAIYAVVASGTEWIALPL